MRDEWFIRGAVPMTKSEVRAVSISKLELSDSAVLWDVGAGTGSVSVEAALLYSGLEVVAFEHRGEAIGLIEENRKKAGTDRISVVKGMAPDSFQRAFELNGKNAIPTHAFIGGSSGRMEEILKSLWLLNPSIRVVINVIALESLAEVLRILKKRETEAEVVSVQVSRAEKAGNSHLMKGHNPVYIIAFGGEE